MTYTEALKELGAGKMIRYEGMPEGEYVGCKFEAFDWDEICIVNIERDVTFKQMNWADMFWATLPTYNGWSVKEEAAPTEPDLAAELEAVKAELEVIKTERKVLAEVLSKKYKFLVNHGGGRFSSKCEPVEYWLDYARCKGNKNDR